MIREVQQYQQQSYTISHNASVCSYLLDRTRLLTDEETYKCSLAIEPRVSKTATSNKQLPEQTSGSLRT